MSTGKASLCAIWISRLSGSFRLQSSCEGVQSATNSQKSEHAVPFGIPETYSTLQYAAFEWEWSLQKADLRPILSWFVLPVFASKISNCIRSSQLKLKEYKETSSHTWDWLCSTLFKLKKQNCPNPSTTQKEPKRDVNPWTLKQEDSSTQRDVRVACSSDPPSHATALAENTDFGSTRREKLAKHFTGSSGQSMKFPDESGTVRQVIGNHL